MIRQKQTRRIAKLAILLCLLAPLSSCGPLFPSSEETRQFFVIEDDYSLPSNLPARTNLNILVRDTKANRFINSDSIIFAEDNNTRGKYQLAQWVEPPTRRVGAMLLARLDRSGVFQSVTHITTATIAEYQLNAEISEFYHDVSDPPGLSKISIQVELVDLRTRSIVARNEFSSSVPAGSYSAKGAVEGLTKGVNSLLNEIVLWTTSSLHKLAQPQ